MKMIDALRKRFDGKKDTNADTTKSSKARPSSSHTHQDGAAQSPRVKRRG